MTKRAMTRGAVLIVAFFLSACQSIPQSGLLYAQHTVGGLDLGVGDTTTSAAHITLGYKHTMGVFLPLVVQGDKIEHIVGTASLPFPSGDSKEEKELRAKLSAAVETAIREGKYADAVSIYSSFEGSATAQTDKPSASGAVGNVFATGLAARNLGAAHFGRVCIRIQELIDGAGDDAAKKKAMEQLRTTLCEGRP